jgi:hypothetical protein
MIDHQIDEEMILIDEVSDDALEAAAFVSLGGFPTLFIWYLLLRLPGDPLQSYSVASFL